MRLTVVFEKPEDATIEEVGQFVLDTLSSPLREGGPSLRGKISVITVHGTRFDVPFEPPLSDDTNTSLA